MPITEGPERGHRLHCEHIDRSTSVAAAGRRARRTSDATDLPESVRAHQKRLQNSDGGARVNPFEYFFGADMGMASAHRGRQRPTHTM